MSIGKGAIEKKETYIESVVNLKEKITIKGVTDYHGDKDEWIIS